MDKLTLHELFKLEPCPDKEFNNALFILIICYIVLLLLKINFIIVTIVFMICSVLLLVYFTQKNIYLARKEYNENKKVK